MPLCLMSSPALAHPVLLSRPSPPSPASLPQLSTACFLFKFWHTLPRGEQAYFGLLPLVFVAHIVWRWRAPRHYLAWRLLSAAFWVMEPLLPRPCWRGWALSTAENALPLLAPGRTWVVRAAGRHSACAWLSNGFSTRMHARACCALLPAHRL